MWTLGLAAALGLATWRAASLAATWRRGEGDWLGARAPGRLAALMAASAGLVLAAWLGALAVAGAAELAAGGGGPALRFERAMPGPALVLLPGDAPEAWLVEDPRGRLVDGSVVRLDLVVLPGAGPTASATLSLARNGAAPRAVDATVAGRGALRAPVPPGDGDLRLELTRSEDGAGLAVPEGGLSLLVPARGEREAGGALLLRALPLLAAAVVLALGAGCWTSTWTATLATWVSLLPLFLAEAAPPLPGRDLPRELALVGDGVVPAAPPAAGLLGAALVVALGWALGAAGLRDWRRA